MDSPSPESPTDGDEIFPCKGCGEILEEGKAFELAGNRWHLNCFRCNTCDTLLDSDANLLLLGDGSLICNNCTYSCHSCHNKIEDLAILTGDQAYCASCFRCRNCKRKIENLRYARTSQGIFCMSCHESLMARRRKKSKAAAQSRTSKEKDVMLVDKSLPALPPSAVPQSAFSPPIDSPGSQMNEQPTELSPRPRGANNAEASAATSPDRSPGDATPKDSLTLPSTTYRKNRHSVIRPDAGTGDGDSYFIPLALDQNFSPGLTPRQDSYGSIGRATKESTDDSNLEGDYTFAEHSGSGRAPPAALSRGSTKDRLANNETLADARSSQRQPMKEQEGNSQTTKAHISALQEKPRQKSIDSTHSPLEDSRLGTRENSNLDQAADDVFRLQEAPKSKRATMSRENSAGSYLLGSGPASKPAIPTSRKELGRGSSSLLESPIGGHLDTNGTSRPSQDTRPSFESSSTRFENKNIARKEVSSTFSRHASNQDMPSSASSSETLSSAPTINGKSISSPLLQSPMKDDALPLPSRAATRPGPPQQKLSDSYMAPRAAPAPPTPNHRVGKSSLGSVHEPASPKLPKHSIGGELNMDEDLHRILNGPDEGSKSIMRRVSNAVRHGRKDSEQSLTGRGHNRSISETTRGTASPRWPKTPITEDTSASAARNISSPISISSPLTDDPALLQRQLANAERRVAELERYIHGSGTLQSIDKKLLEKRKTVVELDKQAEMMVRQIEILVTTVERAKGSEPFDKNKVQEFSLALYKRELEELRSSVSAHIQKLMEEREALEEQKQQITKDRDRALVEFEQLSSKNAQLADMNNDLTHQIQERFKSQSSLEIQRPQTNGLGIYTHNNKAKSSTSIHNDDASMRPSTGTTLQNPSGLTVNSYPQAMDQDMEPATMLAAPHVVNIRKGQAKKFWKSGNVAKAAAKGFKGAFTSGQEKNPHWAAQTGDSIGMPYDTTMVPMSMQQQMSNMPRSVSNDPSRQGGFGLFGKKSAPSGLPKTGSTANLLTEISAEPPSRLFGSFLVERADYEHAQIPSIVTRCIEEVQMRGMEIEGIYRKSGGAAQVAAIKDGFEKNIDYDEISDPELDIVAVTSVLKAYLRKLPNPLLTFEVYDRVLASKDIANERERCDHLRETFSQLPPKHRDCLEYLVFHLLQVSHNAEANKMHPKNIAVVFAPTVMHSRDINRELEDAGARNDVMEFIIEHCEEIFNSE